ncbi:MAG: MEKHLA domain-containing protein [Sedimenticola sp.]|nr:MEKHLA domain-containing protein [Sedimenticola sp.]
MDLRERPTPENRFLQHHAILLLESYYSLTGRRLLDADCSEPGHALYHSPLAVVSHDTADDPVFNYANRTALDLFEMDWDTFTRLPSRLSAEQPNRDERQRLLIEVTDKGFIDHYTGVRISSSGRRFHICNATVWNLLQNGRLLGQAAVFGQWEYID